MRGFRANSAENIRHRRLRGGGEWIRTLGSACLARKRPIPVGFLSPQGNPIAINRGRQTVRSRRGGLLCDGFQRLRTVRELGGLKLVKLLIDGVHFGGHVVLAAWGSMNAAVRTHLALDKDAPAFRCVQATGAVKTY